jgi:hypothetical protein
MNATPIAPATIAGANSAAADDSRLASCIDCLSTLFSARWQHYN